MGHTAVVVGAAGAIGQEVCAALHAKGWDVVGFDRDEGKLADGTAVHACDATSIDDVRSAFDNHVDAAATAALVNVAGRFEIVDFVESDVDHWMRMLAANLVTAMTTTRVVLPVWLERGSGVIVNFASTAGEYGSIRPSAAYAAAKGGVIAFTKSLAREVSPFGLRVNAVSPGPVETAQLQAATPAARGEASARTLLGRLGQPHDIAAAVAYLVSDDAAWVTGEVLRVNGGSLL